MLFRTLVVVGLVGMSLAFNVATAEDAGHANHTQHAIEGVSLTDTPDVFRLPSVSDQSFSLDVSTRERAHFPRNEAFGYTNAGAEDQQTRRLEVALTQSNVGGLDLAVAQRATLRVNPHGDIERHSAGREFRLGQRLGITERQASSWDNPSWYFYYASDDDVVTIDASQIQLQDRVRLGDMEAGITYEAGPIQASFAYIERSFSTKIGRQSFSQSENFTGVTLTMRH